MLDAGPIEVLAGDLETAIAELQRDFDTLDRLGERNFISTVAASLSVALIEAGRYDEADAKAAFAAEVAAPDDDDLANELSSLDYGYDARFRIQLQSKKDLKRAGVKSPDHADSLALSFIPELIDRKIVLAKVRPVERRKVVWSR